MSAELERIRAACEELDKALADAEQNGLKIAARLWITERRSVRSQSHISLVDWGRVSGKSTFWACWPIKR